MLYADTSTAQPIPAQENTMTKFELKLDNDTIVSWSGVTAEDAAIRYVDTFRNAVVIATRSSEQWGIFPANRAMRITQ